MYTYHHYNIITLCECYEKKHLRVQSMVTIKCWNRVYLLHSIHNNVKGVIQFCLSILMSLEKFKHIWHLYKFRWPSFVLERRCIHENVLLFISMTTGSAISLLWLREIVLNIYLTSWKYDNYEQWHLTNFYHAFSSNGNHL